MVRNKHHHRLELDLKSIGIRYAGLYLLNKFFIKIYTGKNRSQIPSYDTSASIFPIRIKESYRSRIIPPFTMSISLLQKGDILENAKRLKTSKFQDILRGYFFKEIT